MFCVSDMLCDAFYFWLVNYVIIIFIVKTWFFPLEIRLKTHQCLWFPPALYWRAVQWLWSAAVMQIHQWTTPGPERMNNSWSSCRLETLLPSMGPNRHTVAGTTVQLRTNMAATTHQWCWTFSVSTTKLLPILPRHIHKHLKVNHKMKGY